MVSPMDGNPPKIAESVRAAIKAENLTQQQVADIIGASKRTVERRLAGERDFNATDIQLLARHLKVSADVLMGLGA